MNPNKDEILRDSIPDGLGYGSEPEGSTPPADGGQEAANAGQPANDPFDIDSLAKETDEKLGTNAEDPFEDDLGWGGPEDSHDEPEPEEDGEAPEATGDAEAPDGAEEPEPDEAELEGEPEGEPEEPEEEEPLYDAKRDYPDADVTPTVYKDRVKLNEGAAAKISHARNLKKQLEDNESGLGAIRLPELFAGDEAYIDRPFDRAAFSDIDDEAAKKAIFELDRFIKDVNSKLDNVIHTRQQQQQVQQVSDEYRQALDQLDKDLQLFDMDISRANSMKLNTLFSKLEEHINTLQGDAGQEYVDEHGAKAYYQRMRELETARDRIQKFPEVASRHKQLQQQPEQKPKAADPKQVKGAYSEMKQDRSDHPVFASKQKEKAFLEWVENELYQGNKTPADTPRKWVRFADEYEELVKQEYERYKSKTKTGEAGAAPPKGEEAAHQRRADRTNKRTPPLEEVTTDKKRRDGGDKLTVHQVDAELERLARETDHRIQT